MTALISVNLKKPIATVDPRIFGLFIEHFPKQIYGGIYQEKSKFSDKEGFRLDVQAALKELAPPLLRWPGGNYTSGYHWLWGVGPKKERKQRQNPHWKEVESHKFGTGEFIEHCKRIGAEPLICVGVGKDERNPTPQEAASWVRYCNAIEGDEANLRAEAGYEKPFKVKWWGLGNECWGPWQIGYYKNGLDYGKDMLEYKRAMLKEDPDLNFVVVGSDPILARKWNEQLFSIDEIVKEINILSYHHYCQIRATTRNSHLKSTLDLRKVEKQIVQTITSIKEACSRVGRKEFIKISVDEWNEFAWEEEKIDENDDPEQYDLAHALYTAGFLNILMRHSNFIIMANYSPSVNTRGLIHANDDGILLRTSYYVFKMLRKCGGGIAHDTVIESPNLMDSNAKCIDATCIETEENNLILNIINRDPDNEIPCKIIMEGFDPKKITSSIISAGDLRTYNTFQKPFEVMLSSFNEKLYQKGEYIIPAKSIIQMVLEK